MNLAAVLIPPSLDTKQALRLRRFGLAALSYVLAASLVAIAWAFGVLPASAALEAAAAFLALNLGLYVVIRSGFNLRFEDPSLTRFQLLAAVTVLMYIVYHMDDGRSIALFACSIVFLFGVFRLNAREFTLVTLYTLAAYALVINLLMHLRPQAIHDVPGVPGEWMSWLALAAFLPCFTIIGGHINTLRRKLRESQVRFRSLTEMSSDYYWETDAEHRLTQHGWAGKASTVSVFLQTARIGEHPWELPSLSLDEAGWQAHRVVLDAHRPFRNFELSRLGADGTERHISVSGDPVFDAFGAFKGYRGVGTDITERKRAESALGESEDRYRDLVENSGIVICTHDLEGKLLSVNAAMIQFTGYSREALLRMNVADLLTQGARDAFAAYLAEIRTKGTARGLMQIRTADGKTRWWEYHNTLRTVGVAAPVVRGMGEDVTERKTAQDALRESEAEFRAIFEGALDGIALVDAETRKFLAGNPELCRMLGYRLEEIVGVSIAGIYQKQDLPHVMEQYEKQQRGETQLTADIPVIRKDGSVFYADIKAARIRLRGKDAMLGIFRDTTERKRMEERLQKLSNAVEQSPAATAITDIHGRFEYVNPKFLKITGYTQEELIGKTAAVIKSDLTPLHVYQDLWHTILSGREWHGELQNRKKNGELYWEDEIISSIKSERGEILTFIAVKEDITERKRAAESLRDSEQELRAIFEGALDGIVVADVKTRKFFTANAAMCSMLGYTLEEIARTGVSDIHPKQDLPRMIEQFERLQRGEIQVSADIPVMRKDGSVFYADIKTSSIRIAGKNCMLGIFRDISERKRAEEALQQEHASLLKSQQELFDARESLAEADRLESVGRLAAGVAHEVKNPLTIIRLGTDYLAKQFSQESNQEVVDDIRAAIDRAEHVIRDLLDFSRQNPFAPRPTNINEVIDNAINLIKHEIERRDIVIIRNRDDLMPPIYADPDRLVQVFINLLSNAAQAIGGDGSIEIVTRSICLSERDLERSETSVFRIGEPVITVDIRDNGPGIPAENEEKLFEPFFTTKPVGEGSGLGLAVSRSIVILHRGSISISNRPEGGASALLMFRVDREHLTNEKANIGSR